MATNPEFVHSIIPSIRWLDLKRLNKDPRFAKIIIHKHLGKTYTLEPNSKRYVLPIPLKVIDANISTPIIPITSHPSSGKSTVYTP